MIIGPENGAHPAPDKLVAASRAYAHVAIFCPSPDKPLLDAYVGAKPIHAVYMYDGETLKPFYPLYHDSHLSKFTIAEIGIIKRSYKIACYKGLMDMEDTTDKLFHFWGDKVMTLKDYLVYLSNKRNGLITKFIKDNNTPMVLTRQAFMLKVMV